MANSDDDFSDFIPQTRAFLNDLHQDNSRDWFAANKTTYDSQLRAPAMALLDTLSAHLHKQTGKQASTKLFRPHRDVRFSKDKTPYHEHLHMLWTTAPTMWFLGIGRDYISVGAGLMGFDKPTLETWRKTVDGPRGGQFESAIADLLSQGARLDPPDLKRVPAPFDKDHPRGDLLRRKGLALWFDIDLPAGAAETTKQPALIAHLQGQFSKFQPLHELLVQTL